MAKTYKIVTLTGTLPTDVDAEGYTTELAAREQAYACHTGEWRIEEEGGSAQISVEASNPRPTTTGVERGVDVDVVVTVPGEGARGGHVTLLPAEDGRPVYTSWGQPDHWVDNSLLGWLRGCEHRADGSYLPLRDMLSEIEASAASEAGRPS